MEPLKSSFEMLRKTYENDKRFCFENLAIDSKEGAACLYSVRAEAANVFKDLISTEGIARFTQDDLIMICGGPRILPYIVETFVPTMTVESLCRKNNVEHVDLLQIDTEGHDYKVLASANIGRCNPWIIGLEHCWLSDDELRLTVSLLKREGYRITFCGNDLLAINPA